MSGVTTCTDVCICLEQGADCLHMVQLMPLHRKTSWSLALFTKHAVSFPSFPSLHASISEMRDKSQILPAIFHSMKNQTMEPIGLRNTKETNGQITASSHTRYCVAVHDTSAIYHEVTRISVITACC